jgi:hypothetical protein
MKPISVLALVALACLPARGQSSASYRLNEQSVNAGGDPRNGIVLVAPSYRVTFDSIGDPLAGAGWTSTNYRIEAGFPAALAPPGEVGGLGFVSSTMLAWSPERSAQSYAIYRSTVDALDVSTGDCFASYVTGEGAIDSSAPTVGSAFFYLVTSRNRLGEEGTKGFRSDGTERANPDPCP